MAQTQQQNAKQARTRSRSRARAKSQLLQSIVTSVYSRPNAQIVILLTVLLVIVHQPWQVQGQFQDKRAQAVESGQAEQQQVDTDSRLDFIKQSANPNEIGQGTQERQQEKPSLEQQLVARKCQGQRWTSSQAGALLFVTTKQHSASLFASFQNKPASSYFVSFASVRLHPARRTNSLEFVRIFKTFRQGPN